MPTSQSSPPHNLPKHLQLAQHLLGEVEAGRLQPGDRLPSFSELRDRHGVSQDVVERMYKTLEADGLVVRQRRRGVFLAPPRVSRTATGLIGFAGLGRQDSATAPPSPERRYGEHLYGLHLIQGAHEAAQRAGAQIILLETDSPAGWDKVDGVLCVGDQVLAARERMPAGAPVVCLLLDPQRAASVLSDDYTGMRQATEHLLGLGHRKVAYLWVDHPFSGQRVQGYRDALEGAGLPPRQWERPLLKQDEAGGRPAFVNHGYQCMRQWLADQSAQGWYQLGCTALLCQNDQTAFGAIEALQEAGYQVPRDVSVVGYDGTEAGEFFTPPLTTVQVPLHEIGARGAALLLEQLTQGGRDSQVSQAIRLQPRLVVRASTAPPSP